MFKYFIETTPFPGLLCSTWPQRLILPVRRTTETAYTEEDTEKSENESDTEKSESDTGQSESGILSSRKFTPTSG